jgi:membrane associated rhomboid family serine protease
MVSAPVGFQCPECVASGLRQTRQNLGPFGGVRSKDPRVTTFVLIGLNVLVWAAIIATGGGVEALWTGSASGMLPDILALRPLGLCVTADMTQYIPGVTSQALCEGISSAQMVWMPGQADGAPWQVLTSAFTHVEALHIGFNMLALWFLGPQLETVLGRFRFLAVYLVSALVGSAGVMWFSDPETSTMGASGAIFGLLGALLVLAWKVGGDVRGILTWLGINLLYTFTVSSISWQGHLGGLAGGAAMAAVLVFAPKEGRERWQLVGVLAILAAAILAIGVRSAMLA